MSSFEPKSLFVVNVKFLENGKKETSIKKNKSSVNITSCESRGGLSMTTTLCCLIIIVNIACERDDCSFILVDAVVLFNAPFFRTASVCRYGKKQL